MLKVTSRWPHQDSIKVEWNLGKRCNYDCSYCPESIHDNVSPHTDITLLKSAVDKLMLLGKPIRLSFTGGEPTVHPKFKDLVSYARQAGVSWISVTTNGTMPAEFYSSLPVDQLVFSVHFEYEWLRVCNTLLKVNLSADIKLIGQLMAHSHFMKDVKTVHEMLTRENINTTVRRIRWTEGDHDVFDDLRYEPDDLAWIKDQEATVPGNVIIDDVQVIHANDVIKLHLNQYSGWSCNAGIESLMINWDGTVSRATCRVGGILSNIYTDPLIVPTDPVICTRNFCTCASDIPITKVLT